MFQRPKGFAKGRKAVLVAGAALALAASFTTIAPAAHAASTTTVKVCGRNIAAVPNNWRADVLRKANNYCGVDYAYGRASYNGIDCSGLLMLSYTAAGIKFPHSANSIAKNSSLLWRDAGDADGSHGGAVPGDIVAFSDDGGASYHHVGIYLGWDPTDKGRRLMIDAPKSGSKVSVRQVWTNEREVYKSPERLVK